MGKLTQFVKEAGLLTEAVVENRFPKVISTVNANKAAIGASLVRGVDNLDNKLAGWVEDFVVYMDSHPGFSAVLAPSSILRRVAYRQTEETINKGRGVKQAETPVL